MPTKHGGINTKFPQQKQQKLPSHANGLPYGPSLVDEGGSLFMSRVHVQRMLFLRIVHTQVIVSDTPL